MALKLLVDSHSLCVESSVTIEKMVQSLAPKIPDAQKLVNWLYVVSDQELATTEIEDPKEVAQQANELLNCNKEATQATSSLSTLRSPTAFIRERFESFINLGLPSPFLSDSSLMSFEQVLNLVVQRQQDQSFLQDLSNLPEAKEVKILIHPLARFLALFELTHEELGSLPFKEVIELDKDY